MTQHSSYTKTAIICAAASPKTGYGKVMSCLGLSLALSRENYRSVFLLPQTDMEIRNEFERRGQLIRELNDESDLEQDLFQLQELFDEYDSDLLIVDSSLATPLFLKKVANLGVTVVVFDDHATNDYPCDLILNPYGYSTPQSYPFRRAGQLLLGPEYAPLREEFLSAREMYGPVKEKAEVVMVTLGVTDPDNQTDKVLSALEDCPAVDIILLVVGIGFPHRKAVLERLKNYRKPVIPFFGVADMAQIMLSSDMAISASGITCYELACLGVPTITVVLNEKQSHNAEELAKRGVTINLGKAREVSVGELRKAVENLAGNKEKRKIMSEIGRKMVDGQGGKRAADQIVGLTRKVQLSAG